MAFAFYYENKGQRSPNHLGLGGNDISTLSRVSFAAPRRMQSNSKGLGSFPDPNQLDRRSFVSGLVIYTGPFLNAEKSVAWETNNHLRGPLIGDDSVGPRLLVDERREAPITVTLPLEPASGGTFCVRCTLFEPKTVTSNNPTEIFKIYRAIVDTGSPYLVLPSFMHQSSHQIPKWIGPSLTNIFHSFTTTERNGERSSPFLANSEYTPTDEIYGSVRGQIDWKLADYKFRDPRLQISRQMEQSSDSSSDSSTDSSSDSSSESDTPFQNAHRMGVVGVLDDALTSEATGSAGREPFALLGLIRNNNPDADKTRFPDPRPTFFEQERITRSSADQLAGLEEYHIKSFSVDGPARELTFSTGSLIHEEAGIMHLFDLRVYGDFVDHYAVLVNSVTLDGTTVTSKDLQTQSHSPVERPIVAVFDTGLTGCLLTREFWDGMQNIIAAADSRENSSRLMADDVHRFHSVSISLRSNKGGFDTTDAAACTLQSNSKEDPRLFYTEPIDLDWFDQQETSPHVIVLGQTFLGKGVLTIDMGNRISTFTI
ncbi:hypothetical protein HJC23_004361 [Cyclotella cryptica]|uniref:Peptidase A1 domain-containing protein n=1 Tax=Cyclotella cryptica TaxID=29204 RepID=A0ABD3NXJ8_9STRA|eukprot:CCRYP_019076-RA/>CCRYP_019076-RA protein AED:0.53 eAED:0.41 QI:0/-1/0/1/-1/1/1/0/540